MPSVENYNDVIRPERSPDAAVLVVSARVSAQLELAVDELAERRGLSRSALLRRQLETAVAVDRQELAA